MLFIFCLFRIHSETDEISDQVQVVIEHKNTLTLSDICIETVSVSAFLKIIADQQTSIASQQETIRSMEKMLEQKEESKRNGVA